MAKATYKNPTAGLSLNQVEDLLAEVLSRLSHGYRLPFMQWFEDDFRGSEGVEEMSPLERLMYRQLLAKAWATKEAPYLPTDEERLKRLCDCPNDTLWEKHKPNVLRMFQESKHEGRMFHPRQLLDYVGQLTKVSANTSNGGKGGRPKVDPVEKITQPKPKSNPIETERLFLANPDETQTKPIKNQNENQIKNEERDRDLEPSNGPTQDNFLEDGQEEQMKAEKAIPVSCMEILGERAETYSDVIEQIKSRARTTSNGQVLREFEEWAVENQGDDFRGKPLSAWLRSYTSGRIEQKQATENPMVKAIGREIAYRSGNQMVLEPKHKAALVPIIEEDRYTFEEVLGAYSEFFQKMDKDNLKNIQYAANNFVAQAADLLYSVRRKATEKQAEQAAVAATAERMQLEAEQDRQKRLEAREREQELVEEELPD